MCVRYAYGLKTGKFLVVSDPAHLCEMYSACVLRGLRVRVLGVSEMQKCPCNVCVRGRKCLECHVCVRVMCVM